jgi:hypothetical protein
MDQRPPRIRDRNMVRSALLLAMMASSATAFSPSLSPGIFTCQAAAASKLTLARPAVASRPAPGVLRLKAIEDKDATVIGGAGVIASCVMLWSEYTLKTTGCGLPAGPGGLLGALEGISYLFVIGLVGWSVFTKVRSCDSGPCFLQLLALLCPHTSASLTSVS